MHYVFNFRYKNKFWLLGTFFIIFVHYNFNRSLENIYFQKSLFFKHLRYLQGAFSLFLIDSARNLI